MGQALPSADANLDYLRSLARAFGGALLFAFPLFMTMEMWELGGVSMERHRLLVLLLATLPVLLGLSYYAGFEPTFRWLDEVLDALAAYGVGVILATVTLTILGAVASGGAFSEDVGRIVLCAVPGAIGALLATKQFSVRSQDDDERRVLGPFGALFLMMVGSIFLAFNVAPTEEVQLISHMMDAWRTLVLLAISIALLHVIVFVMGFPGQDRRRADRGLARTFMTFTLPGYTVALAVSAFCLWTFGRFDGVALPEQATMMVVLGFPAAIGAATARLVI